jgi:hypothetical protein
VRGTGADAGRLSGFVADLPDGILRYDRMVVSRERSSEPARPARIVLSGRISG